jgi:hypothetical protein
VKVHTSLNITVVAFKVLPLGRYAPRAVPSPPFTTIVELGLWNGHQSCRRITPDVINVIKMPSFQYFFYPRAQKKKSLEARCGEYGGCSSIVICLLAKNSLVLLFFGELLWDHFCTPLLHVKIFS